MEKIKKYHLLKNDYSKLHFEVKAATPYCKINAEHCFKAHQHTFYQLLWFEKAGRHFVDYEVIEHPANSLFFLNKGQVHYFCEDSPNEGTLFHFDDLFLHKNLEKGDNWIQYKLFNELGPPFVILSEQHNNEFDYLRGLLQNEVEQQAYNYQNQVFHLFQTLLLKVERLKQHQQGNELTLDVNFMLAMQFKRLIESNFQEALSVQTYSKLLGVSSKKLTTITTAHLGNTPAAVIHQRKVLEAKRMLSNLQLSIKEVAYSLGFDQPTYFTKYFRKHTGFTPKQFIQRLP